VTQRSEGPADKSATNGSGFWRGKRVLVTGAGGFVGGSLAAGLIERGASVVGIIRDARGDRRLSMLGISGSIDVVYGSITDYATVERAFNEYEVEYCFHLAAQAIVGIANRSPLSTFESNIRGTWTMLEAARQSRFLRGFVFASSDKVYGDQPVLPYDEAGPLSAVYPYDASKLCAETLARGYAATYALPVGIVRCANIYGGGDLNWSRIVPGTIRAMLAGEPPVVRSDGTLERDYMYVSDAVNAYLTLAANVGREDVRGEAFNFGWGRGFSALEVVHAILGHAGSRIEPRILGENHGEIQRQWLSSEKAARVLGWQPAVVLDEGIERSVQWYREFLGAPEGEGIRAMRREAGAHA
jgi:CDP-glucose 4,6-dehydratase